MSEIDQTIQFRRESEEHELLEQLNSNPVFVGAVQRTIDIFRDRDFDPDAKAWTFYAGLSGVGKSTIISQSVEYIETELANAYELTSTVKLDKLIDSSTPRRKKLIDEQKAKGRFCPVPTYYLYLGEMLDYARKAHVITSPQGELVPQEYKGSSQMIGIVRHLINQYLPRPFHCADDMVLVTGTSTLEGDEFGIDRGDITSYRRLMKDEEGTQTLIIHLDESEREKVFEFREKMAAAVQCGDFDRARAILIEYDVDDDRAHDNAALANAYLKTGNRQTKEQQDDDTAQEIHLYIHEGVIDYDQFGRMTRENFIEEMRQDRRFLSALRRQEFYPQWLDRNLGSAWRRGGIIDNLPLSPGTKKHVHGQDLRQRSVIEELRQVAYESKNPRLIRELRELHIIEPRKRTRAA